MRFLRLLLLFLIGMSVTGFLLSIDTPRWLVFTIVIIIYLTAMVLPGVYVTYFSNSLRQIERYIYRNRHKAIFAFPYALGHGNDQDVERSIERILLIHKQPVMQSIYRTLLSIYRGQPGIAAQHAAGIDREPMRSYYLAHIAASSGEFQRAAELNSQINEPWMNHSIDALIAFENNDANFHSHVDNSVKAARGIQKYTLEKSFNRMKKPLL
ncbi:hypothetical protein [Planomicrobium sp. Y74]|uniref:hypothetical protein n=1 Tax=Planomicrobium sp. Y74 TaxID=2478977 RepID=UPI000EF4EF62|nr:hypothetical protein [Planomicrobium sp. Y74]RLQ90510.1 hypothetical protein D9754_12415 [Planomicrobium sp. Y74]